MSLQNESQLAFLKPINIRSRNTDFRVQFVGQYVYICYEEANRKALVFEFTRPRDSNIERSHTYKDEMYALPLADLNNLGVSSSYVFFVLRGLSRGQITKSNCACVNELLFRLGIALIRGRLRTFSVETYPGMAGPLAAIVPGLHIRLLMKLINHHAMPFQLQIN